MMTMATGITIQDIAQAAGKCHPDNILQLINSLEDAELHIQALNYDGLRSVLNGTESDEGRNKGLLG